MTTLLSPLLTPLIIYLFLHKYLPIPYYEMGATIFWVMLFPLFDGLILRRIIGRKIETFKPCLPLISIVAISLIIACVVALNHDEIRALPVLAFFAVLLANGCGLAIGYGAAKFLFRFQAAECQAVSFEFGIQDSGLAVMLATKFFNVSTALCGTLYSIVQNVTGPCLVKYFCKSRR